MTHRSIARATAACALALTLVGSAAALAQHTPGPPAFSTPTATTASAVETASPTVAASPAADGSQAAGTSRIVSVKGQPVALSPDGQWLAGPGPDRDFCIWDAATLEPRCAADRNPMAVQLETVTWAPDSSAVAFSLDAARFLIDSDIYVMDTDGTLHDLTDDQDKARPSLDADAPPSLIDMYPAWSPDSQQLIFERTNWGGGEKSTSLVTIGRDGGEPTERFTVSSQEPFVIYSPMHWLADGSVIFSVLHADQSNAQNGVWRLTATGGVERIVQGDESAEIPAPFVNDVSPDGTLATVMSFSRAGQYDVGGEPVYFIVNLKTGEIVPLSSTEPGPLVRLLAPGTFLPDGSGIVSVESDGKQVSLVRFGLDGSATSSTAVPEGAGSPVGFRGPTVSADGTVFLPTVSSGAEGERGGVLLTMEQP